jgi:adenylosuccinate synthase
MTKADVLSGFEKVQVCTSYLVDGIDTDEFPFDIDPRYVQPVYTELRGWNEDLTGIRNGNQIPQNLQDYISFIENALEVPVTIVSVGPDREQTILMR